MEEQKTNQLSDKLVISSRKKWLGIGIIIAILNPVFAGLILGAVYLSEPDLKREGKIIAAVAILWGAALVYLLMQGIIFTKI